MARTGKLDGAMVINDIDLANRLVEAGVKYVAYRPVNGVGDNHEAPFGNNRDIERGAAQWKHPRNQEALAYLDHRIYIQIFGHNEQNYLNDGYWYLGIQQATNRKVLLFGDGVGHPQDLHIYNDKAVSAAWKLRVESGCMREGKLRGNLVCLHQYGRMEGMKATSDPGSAIWPGGLRDDMAYRWFGGRHVMVWRDIIPTDSRMRIFVGECGPSDAIYRGPGVLLSDMQGYDTRYRSDPDIAVWTYWTIGRGGGDPGDFAYSAFDDALPTIRDWIVTYYT